ncbi:MAG: BRO-N domain-containing protein [Stomatobaculum sp.]
MKTENWNGNMIRFIKHSGEWWAVLKDVCEALGLNSYHVKTRLEKDLVSNDTLETAGGKQEMLIVNEFGIYDTVFQSRKKEAKEFRRWVYEMLATLRKQTGLEGFEIFRTLDKEHQKEMMRTLSQNLVRPVRIDFIKANTIANKAVSTRHGYPKLVKKNDMTPEMLLEREGILTDTVELMSVKDRYGIDFSVSEAVYRNTARA